MTEKSESWGDRDLLLTKTQKQFLSDWRNYNEDYTVSSMVFKPFYRMIASLVPLNIAPNIITLVGFLCIVNGYYLCYRYNDLYPVTTTVFSYILSLCYKILNGIDGIHAERLGNVSNLGHLFSRFCTTVGALLQTLILLSSLDMNDPNIQWYAVQIIMMVVLYVHLKGYRYGIVRYNKLFGAQELMNIFEIILLLRAFGMLSPIYYFYFFKAFPLVNRVLRIPSYYMINGIRYEDSVVFLLFLARIVYVILGVFVLVTILRLATPTKEEFEEKKNDDEVKKNECRVPIEERRNSRNSLIVIFLLRIIPGFLIYLNLVPGLDQFDLVCDGLFMCMLVGDIIVSKMCKKALHPWMVVFAISSLLSHFLIVGMICIYYVLIIFEVSAYLNLPVFSINRNVYVDGVYDMCHYGHFKYFERALKEGTRLFVGVMSDADTLSYKRLPVMTTEERCNVVATCRSVYRVIPEAPLHCSKELIEKHNIHVVLCSEEYADNEKDLYYTVPRKMGILKAMPRTKGMSTSELIRRIEKKYRLSLEKDYPHIFVENGGVKLIPELRIVSSIEDVEGLGENGEEKNSNLIAPKYQEVEEEEIVIT